MDLQPGSRDQPGQLKGFAGRLFMFLSLPIFVAAVWWAWGAAFGPAEKLEGYWQAKLQIMRESGPMEMARRLGELRKRELGFRAEHGLKAVGIFLAAGMLFKYGNGLRRGADGLSESVPAHPAKDPEPGAAAEGEGR